MILLGTNTQTPTDTDQDQPQPQGILTKNNNVDIITQTEEFSIFIYNFFSRTEHTIKFLIFSCSGTRTLSFWWTVLLNDQDRIYIPKKTGVEIDRIEPNKNIWWKFINFYSGLV